MRCKRDQPACFSVAGCKPGTDCKTSCIACRVTRSVAGSVRKTGGRNSGCFRSFCYRDSVITIKTA